MTPDEKPRKVVFIMRDAEDKGEDTLWVATTVEEGESPKEIQAHFWNAYLTWRKVRG